MRSRTDGNPALEKIELGYMQFPFEKPDREFDACSPTQMMVFGLLSVFSIGTGLLITKGIKETWHWLLPIFLCSFGLFTLATVLWNVIRKPKIRFFQSHVEFPATWLLQSPTKIKFSDVSNLIEGFHHQRGKCLRIEMDKSLRKFDLFSQTLGNDAQLYEIIDLIRKRTSIPEAASESASAKRKFSPWKAFAMTSGAFFLTIALKESTHHDVNPIAYSTLGMFSIGLGLFVSILIKCAIDHEQLKKENIQLFSSPEYKRYVVVSGILLFGTLFVLGPAGIVLTIGSNETEIISFFELLPAIGVMFALALVFVHLALRQYRKFNSPVTYGVSVAVFSIFITFALFLPLMHVNSLPSAQSIPGYQFEEEISKRALNPCYRLIANAPGLKNYSDCVRLAGFCRLEDLSVRKGLLGANVLKCSNLSREPIRN